MVGGTATEEDKAPIVVDDGQIEWVSKFPYLGSLIAGSGRIDVEIEIRLAKASKAFGALRRAVFKDVHLSMTTKRHVYRACVLTVLLYGSECRVPLKRHLKKLNTFHHRCLRGLALPTANSGSRGYHQHKCGKGGEILRP